MAKSKIVIVGAGVMGQGLAEAIAATGQEVTLVDRTTKIAEKGIKRISECMDREINRWGLTKSDKRAILSRIHPSSDLSVSEDAEIVLEAIHEDLEKKQALFEKLDTICNADAILVTTTPFLFQNRAAVAELARKNRLPTMSAVREVADAGGLVAYGASVTGMYAQAAVYVDKILKGAKPADLPVEQPTKFELVINLKTAKALGLTIPPSLLQRADQVIE